jgi:hypothetical protein
MIRSAMPDFPNIWDTYLADPVPQQMGFAPVEPLSPQAAVVRTRLAMRPAEPPGRMAASAGRPSPDRRRKPPRKPHPSRQPPDSIKISLER